MNTPTPLSPATAPQGSPVTPAHTPGPWFAQSAKDFSPGRHDDERWTVNVGGMPLIAVVEQYRGEASGNARLISASPDLLTACTAAAALLTDGDAEPADADRVLLLLQAAIAKATGVQP